MSPTGAVAFRGFAVKEIDPIQEQTDHSNPSQVNHESVYEAL